jgi:hypothetical protein
VTALFEAGLCGNMRGIRRPGHSSEARPSFPSSDKERRETKSTLTEKKKIDLKSETNDMASKEAVDAAGLDAPQQREARVPRRQTLESEDVDSGGCGRAQRTQQ